MNLVGAPKLQNRDCFHLLSQPSLPPLFRADPGLGVNDLSGNKCLQTGAALCERSPTLSASRPLISLLSHSW